jgi:hypothetical protein
MNQYSTLYEVLMTCFELLEKLANKAQTFFSYKFSARQKPYGLSILHQTPIVKHFQAQP